MSNKVGNITFGPDGPGPKMDKYESMVIQTSSTETKRLCEQRDTLVRALAKMREELGRLQWKDAVTPPDATRTIVDLRGENDQLRARVTALEKALRSAEEKLRDAVSMINGIGFASSANREMWALGVTAFVLRDIDDALALATAPAETEGK